MGFSAAGAAVILGGTAAVSLLTSKSQRPGPPPVMPDLTTTTQAQTLQESKEAALRYGRTSTVLTGTGTSGPASDKLGP